MTLTENGELKLREYLLYHEIDIAYGINDFGELRRVFIDVFDRDPRRDSADSTTGVKE